MDVRESFKLVYRTLTTLVTIALGIGAIAAFLYHTPANQLGLVGGILAILALIAGLSISKLDDQDRRAEAYAEIGREIREKLPFGIRMEEGGKIDWSLKDGAVNVHCAEPEVHRVDAATVDEAKALAAAGHPIDEICCTVDPEFNRHDELHREAFRKLVQAMIAQA